MKMSTLSWALNAGSAELLTQTAHWALQSTALWLQSSPLHDLTLKESFREWVLRMGCPLVNLPVEPVHIKSSFTGWACGNCDFFFFFRNRDFTGHQHWVELDQGVARETPISGGRNLGCTRNERCEPLLAPQLLCHSQGLFKPESCGYY